MVSGGSKIRYVAIGHVAVKAGRAWLAGKPVCAIGDGAIWPCGVPQLWTCPCLPESPGQFHPRPVQRCALRHAGGPQGFPTHQERSMPSLEMLTQDRDRARISASLIQEPLSLPVR